jgi:hypothetical protein
MPPAGALIGRGVSTAPPELRARCVFVLWVPLAFATADAAEAVAAAGVAVWPPPAAASVLDPALGSPAVAGVSEPPPGLAAGVGVVAAGVVAVTTGAVAGWVGVVSVTGDVVVPVVSVLGDVAVVSVGTVSVTAVVTADTTPSAKAELAQMPRASSMIRATGARARRRSIPASCHANPRLLGWFAHFS